MSNPITKLSKIRNKISILKEIEKNTLSEIRLEVDSFSNCKLELPRYILKDQSATPYRRRDFAIAFSVDYYFKGFNLSVVEYANIKTNKDTFKMEISEDDDGYCGLWKKDYSEVELIDLYSALKVDSPIFKMNTLSEDTESIIIAKESNKETEFYKFIEGSAIIVKKILTNYIENGEMFDDNTEPVNNEIWRELLGIQKNNKLITKDSFEVEQNIVEKIIEKLIKHIEIVAGSIKLGDYQIFYDSAEDYEVNEFKEAILEQKTSILHNELSKKLDNSNANKINEIRKI